MNNNKYLQVANILNEAYGEFPDLDKKMKSFFGAFKVPFQNLFTNSKPVELDNKLVKQKFKNIDVQILAFKSKDRNCFTIPGLTDYKNMTLLKLLFMQNQVIDYKPLAKLNINGVKPGKSKGEVIFPSNNVKITIFATWGLLTHSTPEQRLAIYLHEIGHWNYLAKMMPRQFHLDDGEMNYVNMYYLNLAIGTYLRRYNEYESDLFAAKSGYGDFLESALDSLLDKRKNVDWLTKLKDGLTRMAMADWEKWDEKTDSYPTMTDRKKNLQKWKNDKSYRENDI